MGRKCSQHREGQTVPVRDGQKVQPAQGRADSVVETRTTTKRSTTENKLLLQDVLSLIALFLEQVHYRDKGGRGSIIM